MYLPEITAHCFPSQDGAPAAGGECGFFSSRGWSSRRSSRHVFSIRSRNSPVTRRPVQWEELSNCKADVEELRISHRRQIRGGSWKRPGRVRSWESQAMPSHSDRIRLHSKHRDSVSCKRPSFNDPTVRASVQLLLGALSVSFFSTLTELVCHRPWRLPPHAQMAWAMCWTLNGPPRGRHPAPSAPARRAGIDASPVPNLVSELQNREDAVELWLP